MDHPHSVMDDMATTMNHMDHVVGTTKGMDHSGHNMGSMGTTMSMDMGHGDMHMGHGDMDMGHGGMDMGHGTMGMDMHNGSMDMPGMQMYFHDGYKEYVLFEPCLTGSVGAMVGACFIIFALAILYEGLKFLREVLLQRSLSSSKQGTYTVDEYKGSSSQEHITQTKTPSIANRIFSGSHFVQTLLHMVQVFISYCLMLVFMTYNVWLCVAIILGAGVGYFLFGWKRAVVVDSNEHCH